MSNSQREILVHKLRKFIKIISIIDLIDLIEEEEEIDKIKKRRKCWTRQWILRRSCNYRGTIHLAHKELRLEDAEYFQRFFRMRIDLFDQLVEMVTPYIQRQDTHMRQCINPRERVSVTLRFLATGESFRSLAFSTRIPACTISRIIPETCRVIYEVLREQYLKTPNTRQEWESISRDFLRQWNFPNCLGAMDGRHITFRPLRKDGSKYYNYKGTHSIVLLALVDANYQFTYINVGINGRVSDGGVFRESDIAPCLTDPRNPLDIPPDQPLPGMNEVVPFVILGDNAFPLQKHIIKPYPLRNLSYEERIFNYRFSRGRRIVENAFGILANRFRVLLGTMHLAVDKVQNITLTCCALHNFLAKENGAYLCGVTDVEDLHNRRIINGSWRDGNCQLNNLQPISARPSRNNMENREIFKQYFNGVGRVDWQDDMI